MGRVDDALWLANQPDVILTTFGDMMRVPGSKESLLQARARGRDVRFVYSPLDALKIAKENPDKQVIFFAIGFETTAPSTAVTLVAAKKQQVKNFSVFSNHVKIEPPLRAIVGADETRIDGFIGPGHVATVVGSDAFQFLPKEYNKPVVVTGFEPLDILQSVAMLIDQYLSGAVERGEARVENQYSRVIRPKVTLLPSGYSTGYFPPATLSSGVVSAGCPTPGWGFPRNSPPGMPRDCTRYRACGFPILLPANVDRC